jgi:hypothetical protein
MNKPQWFTCTLSAMLMTAATIGWTGTALAEAAAQTGVAAPATEAPATPEATATEAPATPEATAPATEESVTQDTPQETTSYRNYGRYGWRRDHNRFAEQRKALAKARRDEMERWRSMRRWWNNPEAEDRRMWNKARSRALRDMMEARRNYYEQIRPPVEYGYGGGIWRSYRPGTWY